MWQYFNQLSAKHQAKSNKQKRATNKKNEMRFIAAFVLF